MIAKNIIIYHLLCLLKETLCAKLTPLRKVSYLILFAFFSINLTNSEHDSLVHFWESFLRWKWEICHEIWLMASSVNSSEMSPSHSFSPMIFRSPCHKSHQSFFLLPHYRQSKEVPASPQATSIVTVIQRILFISLYFNKRKEMKSRWGTGSVGCHQMKILDKILLLRIIKFTKKTNGLACITNKIVEKTLIYKSS